MKESKAAYLDIASSGVEKGTNIHDVYVDSRLRTNIKTGIEWLDLAAGGEHNPGFMPSSVTLLTAVPGGGKTTLALQAADAITRSGHIALYNSREESLAKVKMTCERIGLPRGFICGEDWQLDKVLAHAQYLSNKHPKKQLFLFLDSLKTLNDMFYKDGAVNSMTPVRVMQKIIEFCKKTYTIAIVIGHVTKDGKFEGKQQIKHDLDAHAHIHFDLNKKSPTYGLRIYSYSKNRCGPISVEGTVLDMDEKGLKPSGMMSDLESVGSDDA
jgi:DNA repair protein RadA/Sms